jgi:ligand-binding SRPBCC domain-containing protein
MELRAESWVPAPLDEVFPFFADAGNLQALTPPWLRFSVQTAGPIEMREGTRIDYRIRVHGVPIRWQSVIARWQPPHLFVDEQSKGPYRRWVHTHRFIAERGGTRLFDDVQFELYVSRLTAPLVTRDLRRIFSYRHEVLQRRFSGPGSYVAPAILISA